MTIQNDNGEQKIVGANELRANVEVGGGTSAGQNLYYANTINIGGGMPQTQMQPSMQMQIPSMQMPEFSGGYADVVPSFSGGYAPVHAPVQALAPVDSGGAINFNELVINKHGA